MVEKYKKFGKNLKKPTVADLRRQALRMLPLKSERDKLKELFKTNPEQLFKDIDKIKNKSWAFKFYSKLLTSRANIKGEICRYAFKYVKKYKDVKWAGKFLLMAMKVQYVIEKKYYIKILGC